MRGRGCLDEVLKRGLGSSTDVGDLEEKRGVGLLAAIRVRGRLAKAETVQCLVNRNLPDLEGGAWFLTFLSRSSIPGVLIH